MRAHPPVLPGSSSPEESPADRALSLALAGERDAALRWSAAILRDDPTMATALVLTGRLLREAGRLEVAREACQVGLACAIDHENLPLAVVAAREAEAAGGDVAPLMASIAAAFCRGSSRRGTGASPPVPLPPAADFHPLPSVLSGAALTNKTSEMVHAAKKALGERERPPISALPLFSALDEAGLRRLCEALTAEWFPAGQTVIEQGETGAEAYWVARGELEARRTTRAGESIALARLRGGSIFGEMALLSRAPRAGSVVSLRPSLAVKIQKSALDAIAADHPEIATELGMHCRDRMVQNLLRTSPVLRVVREADLEPLVARFRIVTFERGARIIEQNQLPTGLFLVASGEVAVVRREGEGEPIVLQSLGPGDVLGEVATIFRRPTSADVVAAHPTVTLFLPTGDFLGLVRDHPAILAELYLLAVQRDDETRAILDGETSAAEDFDLV